MRMPRRDFLSGSAIGCAALTVPAFGEKDVAAPALYPLWDPEIPIPSRGDLREPDGAEHKVLHRAGADRFNFLHDSAIVEQEGVLFAAWYNCPKGEMKEESLIRGRRSHDRGRTWSEVEILASDREKRGIMYVPVAFGKHAGKLYAYISNMTDSDIVTQCEVYLYRTSENTWESKGFIAEGFLPNAAPVALPGGGYIMGGRVADGPGTKPITPAVALSKGGNVTEPWRVVRLLPKGSLPDGARMRFPETALMVEPSRITAFVRNDGGKPILFESLDEGRTWSLPIKHNLPIGAAKIYAGTLSTGQRFILYNYSTEGYRELLVLAVSRAHEPEFSRMWRIHDGHSKELNVGPEWSYPCAIEAFGKLHIVCTSEKRHCVLTSIPMESLRR
jgi:hypothetical protein